MPQQCSFGIVESRGAAAVLNSVESESHGVAASFVNLCRNSGNVIGVAFGTALVTLTMSAAGYPPSAEATEPTEAALVDAVLRTSRAAAD